MPSGLLPTTVLPILGSSSPFGQLPGGLAPVGLPVRVLPSPGTSPVVLPAAPQIGPALVGPSSSLVVAPAQLVAPPQPGTRRVDHGKQKAAGRTAGAKAAAKPTAKAPLVRAAVSTKPVRASRTANALRASLTPAARTTEPGRVTMVRPAHASKAHHSNVGAEHRPVKAHRSNARAGRHRSVKAHAAKAHAGKAHAGKAHAGKAHAGKAHAGKAHAGKAHAGEAQHGAKGSGRSHRR